MWFMKEKLFNLPQSRNVEFVRQAIILNESLKVLLFSNQEIVSLAKTNFFED